MNSQRSLKVGRSTKTAIDASEVWRPFSVAAVTRTALDCIHEKHFAGYSKENEPYSCFTDQDRLVFVLESW